ncbi:zinc ribbon domain regulatory protein CdsZ [Candidatus Similichlamydia laticola]|uniref:Uncharacterized protein n=1 Tax=Candidatus Similichlamydia laticola TaxID=2170265 RepID=A0A369KJ34_9BACT|nr:C4-type zinc ribbon domain-containing protein [Candidatus Similichlamydia laticola]RDB31793.1 hypothetical protein HAT2_00173 [Candidatus Similichlamydia laticola]
MLDALKKIIKIQDLDLKMIRLIRLKEAKHQELLALLKLKQGIEGKLSVCQGEIETIKQELKRYNREIAEFVKKMEKLEEHQDLAKRVEDFNALAQAITQLQREKLQTEQKITVLTEKRQVEQEAADSMEKTLQEININLQSMEEDILRSVSQINEEGRTLKTEREKLAASASPEILPLYERLIRHKGDSVVVTIENRACSGCNILVTAQHENLVRRADRVVFCEHCSRIHYWQDVEESVDLLSTKKRRRRIQSGV